MPAHKPTVALLYGLGEGKFVAHKLLSALRNAGYQITADIPKADILIAHSGGSLVIPPDCAARAVLIAGPITGYRGSLIMSQLRKIRQDYTSAINQGQIGPWYFKSCLNGMYLIAKPRYLFKMWRASREQYRTLPLLKNKRVAIITYYNDPWSGYLAECGLHHNSSYTFIAHRGVHDDIWINPQDYLAVIQYIYERKP